MTKPGEFSLGEDAPDDVELILSALSLQAVLHFAFTLQPAEFLWRARQD